MWANEPVEKVAFLKTACSTGSKIGNYFLSSKAFTILGAMFVFSWYLSYHNTISPNPAPSGELQIVSIEIIIVLISRHPVPPKRSPLSFPVLMWRYYHAFRTSSTASTLRISGQHHAVHGLRKPLTNMSCCLTACAR